MSAPTFEDWDILDDPTGPTDAERELMAEQDELALILGDYDPVLDGLETR